MLTKSDIDWLKSEFIPAVTESIKNSLKDKLDDIDTKMDKFAGEIKAMREEQSLHSEQHRNINDRLDAHDKHLKISTAI